MPDRPFGLRSYADEMTREVEQLGAVLDDLRAGFMKKLAGIVDVDARRLAGLVPGPGPGQARCAQGHLDCRHAAAGSPRIRDSHASADKLVAAAGTPTDQALDRETVTGVLARVQVPQLSRT